MNKRNNRITKLMMGATGLAVMQMAGSAKAAGIVVDGTLDSAYGAPLAVQTNNTGFGDATGAGDGSELDAAYGNISGGNLYLFFAGNLEFGGNYNHLNIFIADGRSGQTTLNAGGSLAPMNGTQFSPGFSATYALDINGDGGATYFNYNDLTQPSGPTHYYGNIAPNNGAANNVANGALVSPLTASFNNTNAAGVNGSQGSAADTAAATAVSTGLEIEIPLSVLGSPTGAINVLADINGGGNNYLSNQFLPGLPVNSSNPGGTTFNDSAVAGQYFTVAAAVASGTANVLGVYNSATGGNYNVAASWLNGKVPFNAGDSATFGSSITAPATITLNSNPTVGRLTFNSANAYTIAPGTTAPGTLTIDDTNDTTGVNPLVTVTLGSHVISAPVALANGVSFETSSGTSLTISGVLSGSGPIIKDGPGSLILTGINTFSTTSPTIYNGTVELDNAAAGGPSAQWFIGDSTSELQSAGINIGVAGITIPNSIVTNHDGSGANGYRVLSGTYTSGNATFSGNLYLDGAVVLTVPVGATLTVSGVIANGQDGSTVASHDLTVGTPNGTTGTVILSNLNTYTGGMSGSSTIYGDTFVDSGTLIIPAGAGIQSNFVTVSQGATLKAAGSLLSTASLYDNGTATLGTSTGTTVGLLPLGSINLGPAASLTFTAAANHSGRTLVTTYSLNLNGSTGAWSGQLDLGNNDMDITSGDINQITNQVAQGYNLAGGAKFNGQGIISTVAATDSRHLTTLGVISNTDGNGNAIFTTANPFDGVTPGASDVLIKFTYYGDANLDGKVDGSDYSLVDSSYALEQQFGVNLSGWYNGDFNYDGVVDGSDYALMDNAFNNQKTDALAAAIVATSTAQVAPAAVPEPAALTTAAALSLAAFRRRRR